MSSGSNLHKPTVPDLVVRSNDVTDTKRIGARLAAALGAGDLVCISGPLGAGKSEMCRAIIRALMSAATLEVPSPSYTLVNVYDRQDYEIWHADLYRIGDESELEEIGLEDASTASVVLVEWPERWPDLPARRLEISIDPTAGDLREISIAGIGANWKPVIDSLKVLA